MGRPRRISDDGRVWTDAKGRPIQITEVTIRATMGQMLLTPTARNAQLIMGVFGRAMARYDTELYVVASMGNHMGYVVGFRDVGHQSAFMRFVHGNVAKELGRNGDFAPARPGFKWYGRVWGQRGKPIAVLTETDAVARLKYQLSNGTKEGLARSPRGMGGAHSGKALCSDLMMYGEWVDRTLLSALRKKRGRKVSEAEATTAYEIKLAKLPHLRHLSDDAYRDMCAGLCDEIVAEAKAKFGAGYTPMGMTKRRKVDPLTIPNEIAQSPAPFVHCRDPDQRRAFVEAYREFVTAYQLAHDEVKRCVREGRPVIVRFPPGGNDPPTLLTG